ncbi:MAG: ferredoxin [Patescibacteria group bacterium]|jgi:ferredoxin
MIKVDQSKCVGCGMCVASCPEIFRMNADGKAEAIKKESNSCSVEAAANCPVGAISVD